MLINTSLSPETAAQDLRSSRGADASPAPTSGQPQNSATDPALARLQGLAPLDEGGIPAITDAAGADQVTQFFRVSLSSHYGNALAGQANLNPESVYTLLQ